MSYTAYTYKPQFEIDYPATGKKAVVAKYPINDLASKNNQNKTKAPVIFTSLSAIEKGFFLGIPGSSLNNQFISEFNERWNNDGDQAAALWLKQQLKLRIGADKIKLNEILTCSRVGNFNTVLLDKFNSGQYDYFDELKNQYLAYLKSQTSFFNHEYPKECFIPVIGGIHSLGIGNPEDSITGKRTIDVDLATLKSRIRQLKGDEELENGPVRYWKHRPLYITFAQHFFNTLCGHSRSFSKTTSLLFDQRKGMDLGMLSGSLDIWRELLGLTPQLENTGSSRILIDIHHMSANARLAYYQRIIHPYNRENKENPIPVIASFSGYSAIDFLQNLIDLTKKIEEDQQDYYTNGFLSGSINLTDEDVLQIFESSGLLGLSLDHYQLGGGHQSWIDQIPFSPLLRQRSLSLLKRNIKHFVRIPFEYQVSNPLSIWNRLTIGSMGNDIIQPLFRYTSGFNFEEIERDLTKILEELKRDEPTWFGNYHPEDLANMICYTNAHDFTKRHYLKI